MLPPEVPAIAVYAGDTTPFNSYTLQAGEVPAPINLVAAGWTAWKAHWRARLDASAFVELTVDDTQASSGIITVYGTAEQTSQMNSGGYWDLQSTKGTEIKTWVRGRTTFVKDVSR